MQKYGIPHATDDIPLFCTNVFIQPIIRETAALFNTFYIRLWRLFSLWLSVIIFDISLTDFDKFFTGEDENMIKVQEYRGHIRNWEVTGLREPSAVVRTGGFI